MNKNLYVITPIFNPHQFRSRAALYKPYAKHMEDTGAKLFTIEAAFGEHSHEVTHPYNPMNLQVRTSTLLWHKERMINLARRRILQMYPDAKYFCWNDGDLSFANLDWAGETVHQLMHHPVVQPFATTVALDQNEDYQWHCPSSLRSFIQCRGFHQEPPLPVSDTYKGHPGLSWAATNEALEALGDLYEVCIAGSGDTVMSNCLKGQWDAYLPGMPSEGMKLSIQAWAEKCDAHIKGNLGWTRGVVLHHWHGRSEKRGYEKRWDILSFHKFDPTTDLKNGAHGMLEWAGNKPRMEDDIRLSLSLRDEDSR